MLSSLLPETTVPGIIQQTFPGYPALPGTRALHPGTPRYPRLAIAALRVVTTWLRCGSTGYVGMRAANAHIDVPMLAAVLGAAHWLTVRVLNPITADDGIVLNETPHRNKYVPFANGARIITAASPNLSS